MKRTTHILLGAAVAMPIAASLSPAVAIGAVWLGMVGGGYPDWIDLRSDFKARLKHRGVSHSILLGVVLMAGVFLMLQITTSQFPAIALAESEIRAMTLTFALGFLSHLLADACTYAGVRPLLPFSNEQWWILPKPLRGKSSGAIDTIGRFIALILLIFSLWQIAQNYLP